MNRLIPLSIVATLGAALLAIVGGCETFQSRVRQNSAVFEALPERDQKRLERGVIRVGDTEEMVYIALGRPDEKRVIQTPDGERNIWSYRSYWQEYAGSEWIGWHRMVTPGPRGFVIFHQPVSADLYRTHVEERIRVTFQNGRVVSVDQQQES